MMLGHYRHHHFNWAFVIKALARMDSVRTRWRRVALDSGKTGQCLWVGTGGSGHLCARCCAAAKGYGIGEVNSDARALCDFGVPRYFASLAMRLRFTDGQRHTVQHSAKTFDRRGRRGVVHPHQIQLTRAALHRCAYGRRIGLALDEIALPMAGSQTDFHFRRADMNIEQVGDLATTIIPARTRAGMFLLCRRQMISSLRSSPTGRI